MEFIHQYIVLNGKISLNNSETNNQLTVYEVIRIIESIPLFYEKHYQRLQNSASLLNKSVQYSFIDLKKQIDCLLKANAVENGNIKITISYDSIHINNYTIGLIPQNYPTREEYSKGIKVATTESERANPNAKIQHNELRKEYNRIIKEKEVYKVILLNKNLGITEGSRSNIFFIKNKEVITAQVKDVLAGITREMVVDVIKSLGIQFSEKLVNLSQISEMDAAFITGTSPKVLPVRQFNEITYGIKNSLLFEISRKYDQLIEDYIRSHQKNKRAKQ
jgi:branched-chain amino acid aminotransferase